MKNCFCVLGIGVVKSLSILAFSALKYACAFISCNNRDKRIGS